MSVVCPDYKHISSLIWIFKFVDSQILFRGDFGNDSWLGFGQTSGGWSIQLCSRDFCELQEFATSPVCEKWWTLRTGDFVWLIIYDYLFIRGQLLVIRSTLRQSALSTLLRDEKKLNPMQHYYTIIR